MSHAKTRLATAMLSAFISLSVCAHDGDLDRSFGTGGVTLIDFGAASTAFGMALAPDGSVVLGGATDGGVATGTDFAAARLTPDGLPDPTFSFDGRTTIAVGAGASTDTSFNTIVQSDGKIVLVGDGPDTDATGDDTDMEIVRLATDGTLDTTFSGDGKAFVNFDLGIDNNDRALDAVQLPDGKLVVVGTAEVTGQDTDFAITRLNIDGSRDTSFSGDGRFTFHFDLDPVFNTDIASSVAIDAAGNILVAGVAEKGAENTFDFAIARITPAGVLDPNFGGDGRVTVGFDIGGNFDDEVLELFVAPDGSIFMTGVATDNGYDFAAVKLLPDGSPDTTFGTNGKVTIPFDLGGTNSDTAYGSALQPDGKLLLIGFAPVSDTNTQVALARLDTHGALDPTFGFAGKKTFALPVGDGLFDGAVRGRIQGNYLVFGGVASSATSTSNFVAGRVIIDTLFDNGFE